MEITSVSYDNVKKTYEIEFSSDSPVLHVSEDTLYYFNLYAGKIMRDLTIEEIRNKDLFFTGLKVALKFLKNMKTSYEITVKLREESIQEVLILDIIDYLEDNKLIDDLNYAKLFISDKSKINKYGKNKIYQHLYKRGIEKHILQEAFKDYDYELEYENALYFAHKKNNTLSEDDKNIKPKVYRNLYTKGFESETINSVMKEVF